MRTAKTLQTAAVAVPRAGALRDFILAFRDGTGIPYEVSGDGTLVVDFARKMPNHDAVRLYFRPLPPRLGDLAMQVSGSGTIDANKTVFGKFELPRGADMSGNPTDARPADRFSGRTLPLNVRWKHDVNSSASAVPPPG